MNLMQFLPRDTVTQIMQRLSIENIADAMRATGYTGFTHEIIGAQAQVICVSEPPKQKVPTYRVFSYSIKWFDVEEEKWAASSILVTLNLVTGEMRGEVSGTATYY